MASPRAALRGFLTARFQAPGALRRFVQDHFAALVPELSDENLLAEAETFIGGLTDRGLISDLWPLLRQARSNFAEEIARLEESWAAAAAGGSILVVDAATSEFRALERAELVAVYKAATEASLQRDRAALLAGISRTVLAALPPAERPSAQLLSDLDRLNAVAGSTPPLALWLENAQLVLGDDEDGSVFARALARLAEADEVEEAVESEDAKALEAIILATARPALLVRDRTFDPSESSAWEDRLDPARSRVEAAIRATGRLAVTGHPSLEWFDTAFAVSDEVICTASLGVRTLLDGLEWKEGPAGKLGLKWSPFREHAAAPGRELAVSKALLVHPSIDVAFLRVAGLAEAGIEPLTLAARERPPGTALAAVDYVDQDSRIDVELQRRVFHGLLDGWKWVLPGEVISYKSTHLADVPWLMTYDSSTLGGISGSPLVGLGDGRVIGVGVARKYLIAKWAVAAWEILRDPRIRDLGIEVPDGAPPADDPWADDWKNAE